MSIADLKRVLKAGARPNKYQINFNFPTVVGSIVNQRDMSILCKAAQFPSKTVGTIEVFNQGRKLPLPGDTAYENTWSTTFYNTETHDIRRDILNWMKAMDNFQANYHSGEPAALMVDCQVKQLDSKQKETAIYTFHNFWPSVVSEIEIDAETQNAVETFTVTWTFSDWVVGVDEEDKPVDQITATGNLTAF